MTTTGSLISLDDVHRARERIRGRLHRTPLLSSATLSERVGADVRFKAELLQRTGSFKPRGVLNKLATLTDEDKQRGVISISAGNHAQALAYASAVEGIDALVVMWQTASPMKIAAARGYGATIDTEALDIPTAFERLEELIESTGRTLVHPYDDPLVMAGQGTVGVEMLEDAPEADVILVQVGGGGLVSGIATAVKGMKAGVRVVAVEPERSPARSPAPPRPRPCSPVRSSSSAAKRWQRSSRAATSHPKQPLLSWLQKMKTEIHPDYVLATVTCSCGNTFQTRSTKPELHVEICSNCHPFYTGKQKLVDTGGRVERFQRRLEKAGGARRG